MSLDFHTNKFNIFIKQADKWQSHTFDVWNIWIWIQQRLINFLQELPRSATYISTFNQMSKM